MKPMVQVSIPLYNEKKNISRLLQELDQMISSLHLPVEVLIIDDHSEDGSYTLLLDAQNEYNWLRVEKKKGSRGKAHSLLESFELCGHPYVVMIDADLQYPVAKIPEMIDILVRDEADIVIGQRESNQEKFTRKILSKLMNFLILRTILGLEGDVQSGLKAMKLETLQNVHLRPSQWGFDYEYLFYAKQNGYRISHVPIEFVERVEGKSKVNVMKVGLELLFGALKLRFSYKK